MARRTFGPYANVGFVDVTKLGYSVKVFYADVDDTSPAADGPRLKLLGLQMRLAVGNSVRVLDIVGARDAIVAEGKRYTVLPNHPFRREVPGSPVQVTMFVKSGTVVLH